MEFASALEREQDVEALHTSGGRELGATTVVIPAYNERNGIVRTIEQVRHALADAAITAEIIVVDDGSADGTGEQAEATGVRVLRQPVNRGYGAALKTGIVASKSEFILIIDADGTYPATSIPQLLAQADHADMVVGSRNKKGAKIPWMRRPAKWFLTKLASYLAGQSIPDLNSGLRLLRRSATEPFLPILPQGFSFTTTITLSMLCTNRRVAYVPIDYHARIGKSKIRPTDFVNFLIIVLRTVVLFNPLKVFLPLGAAVCLMGIAKFIYDVTLANLSESAVMAMLAALIIWSVGLLADLISRLHLRPPGAL